VEDDRHKLRAVSRVDRALLATLSGLVTDSN
jgi:hypothetical protein